MAESMLAVTVTEPWAALLACGAKRYETRSWQTTYRGPLAIHAGKGFPREARWLIHEEPFRGALLAAGYPPTSAALPRGEVLAIGTLRCCIRCDAAFRATLSAQEFAFGDFRDGRYAWELAEMQELPEPIPATGRLGLWPVAPVRPRPSEVH